MGVEMGNVRLVMLEFCCVGDFGVGLDEDGCIGDIMRELEEDIMKNTRVQKGIIVKSAP